MPFSRISLKTGRPTSELVAISDALDQALTQTFQVPPNDKFQIFHQHTAEEMVFDRHYGGGPRSENFILFHITTGKARTDTVKRAFYADLVARLQTNPGIRPEDVMIVIANSDVSDWSFAAGASAADM